MNIHRACSAAVNASALFVSAILLSACGGGGGAGTVAPAVEQGVFTDGPVEGVQYTAGSRSGITDAAGTFEFAAGDTVRFQIGQIVIGETTAASVVTPLDLVNGASDETNAQVTNIARLLQSLDNDADPSNGIQINAAVRDAAASMNVDFAQAIADFELDGNVQTIVATLTALTGAGARALVTSQQAQSHLRGTLLGLLAGDYSGVYVGDDLGAWFIAVDANGTIDGVGTTAVGGTQFAITGAVTSGGSAAFASTTTSPAATYTGAIRHGEVSGTWTASNVGASGTFLGFAQDAGQGSSPGTVPQFAGTYPVAANSVSVSRCMDPGDAGTYSAYTGNIRIIAQHGAGFAGVVELVYTPEDVVQQLALAGTVSAAGVLEGALQDELRDAFGFLDSGGSGTFTGQVNAQELRLSYSAVDEFGDTCEFQGTATFVR